VNLKSLSNQPLSVLISAASPGSALAHQLGVATFGPMLLRRGSEPLKAPTAGIAAARRLAAPPAGGWLARLFERLENWAWDRQQREREAFLAQSADLYDLEYRMRQLDSDMVSRGCMLR
jgi:hypothetical protein